MADPDLTSQNVRLRDVPREVHLELNKIAEHSNRPKWEVVREALIEYVERHRVQVVEKVSA